MTPLDLANKYMEILFTGNDPEELKEILSDNCNFSGPLFHFKSAQEYIDSLIKDPPFNFNYKIIKSYEDNQSACLIYKFTKRGISTIMSQLFEVSDNKISAIRLIFDTMPFKLENRIISRRRDGTTSSNK